MSWYLAVLKKYAVFRGRARRKEFWMFYLINLLFSMCFGFIEGALGLVNNSGYGPIVGLYSLAVLLPTIAVGVRRLHDTGKSGWWMLLALVPILGLVVIFWYAQDGDSGSNEYGPDPKAPCEASALVISPAGWLPDPSGRHQLRYWDSTSWTHNVSDDGVVALDPI